MKVFKTQRNSVWVMIFSYACKVQELNSFRLPLFIVSLIVCSVSAPRAESAPAQASSGWLLAQRHKANGDQLVYVFPEKLRVENTSAGNTLIADANTGNVWIFSDAKKVICTLPWDKYEHSFSQIMQIGGENLTKFKWGPAKDPNKTVIASQTTKCYKAMEDKLLFKGGGVGFVSGGTKRVFATYTLYTSDKIRIAPKLVKVLSQLQTLPTMDGVPLREESRFSDSMKVRAYLNTTSTKQIPDDKKYWQIPKYRQVARVSDVTSVTDTVFIEDLLGKP